MTSACNILWSLTSRCAHRFIISRFKYDPVPGVDGALVTFELIPPSQRKAVRGVACQGPGSLQFCGPVHIPFSSAASRLRLCLCFPLAHHQSPSAVPSSSLQLPSDHKFLVLLNKAFGGRRKMLRNSLQPLYSQEQVRNPKRRVMGWAGPTPEVVAGKRVRGKPWRSGHGSLRPHKLHT